MYKYILAFLLILSSLLFYFFYRNNQDLTEKLITDNRLTLLKLSQTPTPSIQLITAPLSKVLQTDYHVFQTFNNCGPAALSMVLRFYGINVSQQELGRELRPWQNPQGINDDKSVPLEELAEKANDYNLFPYHRPNGNIEIIKKFITYDIPILTRTWTKIDEDIGHFRLIKGYNDQTQQLIQDDSLQNKNLWYKYEDFNAIWEKFGYEYLVLVPQDKKKIAEAILGEDADAKVAWQKAANYAQDNLANNPNDVYTRFNLSVALYEIGDYQRSVDEFEKVESQLPFRTLWYQIEPILAYYESGHYQKVFEISEKILNNQNLAYSELYYLRGQIYLKQNNREAARQEFEKAILYKHNYLPAQEAFNTL